MQIPTIQDVADPQGRVEIVRRGGATADDFGAQVGQSINRLAGGLDEVGGQLLQYQQTQDATDNHVALAKAKASYTAGLQTAANEAKPGDDTFAPNFVKTMADDLQKRADSITTGAGKKQWAQMSADLMSQFYDKAASIQGDLAGQAAINKFNVMMQSNGRAAQLDETLRDGLLKSTHDAIYDRDSMYKWLDVPRKDAMYQKAQNDIDYATAYGYAQRRPMETLASLSPEMAKLFNPYVKLLQGNATLGGKLSITPETMARASEIVPEASKKDISPNILMAQMDAKNTKSQTPQEMASSMKVLLNTYGGDYAKALAAYHGGTDQLDRALKLGGTNWQASISAETRNYVSGIMESAGAVAGPPSVEAMALDNGQPQSPDAGPKTAASTLPFMNGLSREQMNSVTGVAVNMQHLNMSMEAQAREKAEIDRKAKQEDSLNKYIMQIEDPRTNGAFDRLAAANDPTLDFEHKARIAGLYRGRIAELQSLGENRSHPTEFRRVMEHIHAADKDPSKTYSDSEAWSMFEHGQLSWKEFTIARNEVANCRDSDSNPFQQQLHSVTRMAHAALTGGSLAKLEPAEYEMAVHRFRLDLEAKVAEYRAQNKDPRSLLDPNSPDSFIKPGWQSAYAPYEKQVLADGAQKRIEAGAADIPVVSSEADYAKLKDGTVYRTATGAVLTKGKAKRTGNGASGGW